MEKSKRGFASMSPEKQREIASKGGQSVKAENRTFSRSNSLATEAGRKGGQNVPPESRSYSQNRELAAEAGRKGGLARGKALRGKADGMEHSGQSGIEKSSELNRQGNTQNPSKSSK